MPNVRSCEIVSRLYNDDGEMLFDLNALPDILDGKSNAIQEWAYCIHNKDVYTEEDEKRTPEHKSGTLKPEHIHLVLRFKRNQPQNTEYIAKWFNIPENFVSKIRGKFEDAVLYLIHKNAPEKFQYDISEVVANFKVETYIENCENQSKLSQIIKDILSGEIREYNKTIEIDSMLLVNPSDLRIIENAFKVRSEYLQATKKHRNTTCIYICGKSGAGKTTFAKKLAEEKNMEYFISSGSNDIMDGYAQQPCLICDDIRPSCLGLSDLLKMLDPYTASSIKSRYKNKYLNADLIILTSVLPIEEFYHNVFEHENEPITQLKRRCQYYIKMDMTTIRVQRWDNYLMRYSEPIEYRNDIIAQYHSDIIADDKTTKEHIEELLPFLNPKTEDIKTIENTEDTTYNQEADEIISDEDFMKLIKMDD